MSSLNVNTVTNLSYLNLIPITTEERNSLVPVIGTVIYNLTTLKVQVYTGTGTGWK